MANRSSWIPLTLMCVLPALAVDVHTPHASFVASFFYACPESNRAPTVRMTYTVANRPAPRPPLTAVEVFERGKSPTRRYLVLGKVQVLAHDSRVGMQGLTDVAIRSARHMGGDAIVDVEWQDAGSTQPRAGDVGQLLLTADVARWEQ